MKELAVFLIGLTGPNGQRIDINPANIVSVRDPRGEEHFAPGVKCLIHMSDGKIVVVVESCEEVRQKLLTEGVE